MRFFTLSCPCLKGEPALAIDDDGVELITVFRSRTAAEVEASEFHENDKTHHSPTVMEFECKAI